MKWLVVLLLGLCLGAECSNQMPPHAPSDRPYYPAGMVQQENRLLVVSANFDKRYSSGSVLSIDLNEVDKLLDPNKAIFPGDLKNTSFTWIPSFGESPVLVSGGLLLLSREHQQMLHLDLNSTSGALSCGTAKGDCTSASVLTALNYRYPYYMEMLWGGEGIIGYLEAPRRRPLNQTGSVDEWAELQRFSFDATTKQISLKETYRIQDIIPKDPPDPTKPTVLVPDQTQMFARLGAMKVFDKNLFVGVDALLSYGDLNSTKKNAKLLWFSLSENSFDAKEVKEFNLSSEISAQMIKGFDFTATRMYVILEEPGTLVRLDIVRDDKNKISDLKRADQVSSCEGPAAVSVAPNGQAVLVVCERSHDVVSYRPDSFAPLSLVRNSGRSPVRIWFDTRGDKKDRFYVSYFFDGSIGVFELDANGKINPLGRIFPQSAPNHKGGT